MIVLDTNVVSEALKPAPDPRVVAWLTARPAADLFVTTITAAELWFGAEILPLGRRRTHLEERIAWTMDKHGKRMLDFDLAAAGEYARRLAAARRAGRAVATADALIAAIAAARGFAVASRDTAPFAAMGVPTLDPFAA